MNRPLRGHQLLELIRSEWLLREQSSLLGFFWTLLHPMLFCVSVLGIFFRRFDGSQKGYAAVVLVGLMHFIFFTSATSYGMTSLIRRGALARNFLVPPEAIVVSAVMSSAISHLLQMVCMALALPFLGVELSWAWLTLGPLFLMNLALTLGLSFFMAPASIALPDLPRVWGSATTLLFFLTPIVYRLESLDGRRRGLVSLNPLSSLIEMSRACLLQAQWPSAARMAAFAFGYTGLLAAGLAFFRTQTDRVADRLPH